jgi:hypothetical protein
MIDYITYYHIDSSLSTFTDLLSSENTVSIINVGIITKIELFAYSGLSNNLENIYNQYSVQDQKSNNLKYTNDKSVLSEYNSRKTQISSMPEDSRKSQLSSYSSRLQLTQIDVGTVLYIPLKFIRQENVIIESNQSVKQESFKSFYVNELKFLYQDTNYRKIIENLDGNLGSVKDYFPDITVWIWSRTLNKVINVTPFVKSVITTNSLTGGNWSLSLPSIKAVYNLGWEMDGVQLLESTRGLEYLSDNNYKEPYYFSTILQENDIIFIRFEVLKNEVSQRIQDNKTFEIPFSAISKGQFDMIGLIDNVSINNNPSSLDVNIEVTGRDLIKLLIEDGTYFFAVEQISGGIFVKNENTDVNLKRVDGKLYQLSTTAIKTIDFSLKFIINALSNIVVCPDSVFSSYANAIEINNDIPSVKDIRSKTYRSVFKGTNNSSLEIKEETTKGIWQIINLVIDSNIKNLRLVDQTLGNEMGSILNAINKVCQQPFVEFFSDTYRNKFFFIARRPPFDKKGYKDLVDIALTIESGDVANYNFTFGKNQIYSWYHLTPNGAIDEIGQQAVWAYLKAIKFKEYTEVFGDKCLNQVSNYIFYHSIVGEKDVLNINSITRDYILQLQYLIECNQYIPFTRSGQIVINEDRRIKRGTIIYFELTNEYCYVDQVVQSYNKSENTIDRTTTLQVSRCMIKDYVDKYFDIINLGQLSSTLFSNKNVVYQEFVEKYMNNWRVNQDIFNFFLNRQQFSF